MRYMYKFGLAVCSVVVVIVCIEMTLRVFHVAFPLEHEWLFHTYPNRTTSDRYIFERTDLPSHMDQDSFRVAVIGDSFSECEFMADVTCFSDMIATQSSAMQIYNFAAAGMNTDQELKYFIERILPQKPNVVIWQVYVNDVAENLVRPLYTLSTKDRGLVDEPAIRNWLYQRQMAYEKLPYREELLRLRLIQAMFRLFEVSRFSQIPVQDESKQMEWSIEKIRREIEAMNTLAKEHDFDVLYVHIPPQGLYLTQERCSPADQDVRTYIVHVYRVLNELLASQEGYIDIDFSDELNTTIIGESSGSSIADTYYVGSTDSNIRGDKHINTLGQAVVAEQIMNKLHLLMNDTILVQ